jgi:Fe2+ transport system protein FeoA
MLTLNDLKPGDNAIVTEIDSTSFDNGYLMELGIMTGTPVRFIKSAPLGDPIEVNFRGYNLSISRAKAKSIIVKKD